MRESNEMRLGWFRLMIVVVAGLAVLAVLAGVLVARRSGGEEKSGENATATATATPAPAPTTTPTPQLPDIRSIDLSKQSDVAALTQRLSGQVDPGTIIYSDLTGDGREEAVVPISSGGTAGNPAFIVVGYRDGKLVGLLTEVPEEGSVQVQVVNKQLVESVPVYSTGDLPGFPSEIKNIYYAWNGSGFVVAKQQTFPNPSAPPKE